MLDAGGPPGSRSPVHRLGIHLPRSDFRSRLTDGENEWKNRNIRARYSAPDHCKTLVREKGVCKHGFVLRLTPLSSDPDEMELLVVPRVELLEEFREHLREGGG